jgi:isoquinoline 1-oxidoreductase beta subunit
VVNTREDDFNNDYFRPANHSRVKAALDNNGKITAWSHKIAAQSVMTRLMPGAVKNGIDPDAVSGVWDMPYKLPNLYVEYAKVDLPVNVGFWRSVGYSLNTFVVESVIDDLAFSAGKDPLVFRLEHLDNGSREHKLLTVLADKGGWNNTLPTGRARGVALTSCFESVTAHMAEISVDNQGRVKVHKMVCAIDCGTSVYPDAIRAQAEGGVIMGLSVAFYEKVRFDNGGTKTSNYNDYRVITMSDIPEIEVYIADSGLKAGGIGEPVFPSVAPAVGNAIFKATGIRLRELPFDIRLLAKT